MKRAEMIDEIVDLYFKGVPLKVAIADFKDEIKKQLKGDNDGVCKVPDTSNEDK
jgi:hypothetical protein